MRIFVPPAVQPAQTTRPSQLREVGLLLSLSALLQRYLPRGRGAVPRWLGKTFARDEEAFLTTRHGAKLVLSSDCYDVYATMRLYGNAWDYLDFQICHGCTVDGGSFYDIGANVGYMSVEMAAVSGGGVNIVAFEPQTRLAHAIKHSARLNGFTNLQVFDALVGDRSHEAQLFLAPASTHASGVLDSGRPSIGTVPKEMVAIDDLVACGSIPAPTSVKMDVEGSEHLVFRGATRTFREARPHIFLEYFWHWDPGARIRDEVEALLRSVSDYELYGYLKAKFDHTLFRMRSAEDWQIVHGLVLRNRTRPIRSPELFEP